VDYYVLRRRLFHIYVWPSPKLGHFLWQVVDDSSVGTWINTSKENINMSQRILPSYTVEKAEIVAAREIGLLP
jgi:hypothetical protein